MTETNEEQRTPGFQRALVGKLIAVGIFVALGTVAVFYSMRACTTCEPTGETNDSVAALESEPILDTPDDSQATVKPAEGLQIQPVSTAAKTSLPPIISAGKSPTNQPPTARPGRLAAGQPGAKQPPGSNGPSGANQLMPNRVTTQRPASKSFVPPKQSGDSSDNSFGGQSSFQPPPVQLPKKNIVADTKDAVSGRIQQLKNATNDLAQGGVENSKSTANNLAENTGNALRNLTNQAGQIKNNLIGNSASQNANAPPTTGNLNGHANSTGSAAFDKSKNLQPFATMPRTNQQQFSPAPNGPATGNTVANPKTGDPQTRTFSAPPASAAAPAKVPTNQQRLISSAEPSGAARQPAQSTYPDPSRRQIAGTASPMSQLNPMTRSTPGDPKLEGVQSPSITIERIAPSEIQVNQPADFQFVVKNVGRVAANHVRIYDEIPEGTELIQAVPQPSRGTGRQISWDLDTLNPGQEKRIKLQLRPTKPGEIGSVAQFSFSTSASMRTKVTQPRLSVRHSTTPRVLIGDPVILDIDVKNDGDGPARDVVIQEDLPEGLEFSEGFRELEYAIGTLGPGQSKKVRLELRAARIGRYRNTLVAYGSGGLQSQHALDLEVIAPKLVARGEGPSRRFLNRQVTHNFSVNNSGTANATNVELVCKLPTGLRFVSANNRGQYDENTHSVYWSLAELNAGLVANVEVTTNPTEPGNQDLTFTASADLGQSADAICQLSVEHLVDVFFDIDDIVDPIEVGSATVYKLRIINQGTKTATNIQLSVEFPRGIEPTAVEGNVTNEIRGQQIAFSPITSMNPGDEIEITLRGKGVSPGDHKVVVNLVTDGREGNVAKQESTRVYSDR